MIRFDTKNTIVIRLIKKQMIRFDTQIYEYDTINKNKNDTI
jgi:hypothetical protein